MSNLSLDSVEFGQFRLSDIFKIENCKCSKVSELNYGNIPYVGATNRNNGVLAFVDVNKDLITKGNCIAFICDGEGSIGYSIYKKEDFVGSTTVKVGRNPKLNKYNGLFITAISNTVRGKYNFGYKRNEAHLKAEILQLPIDSVGNPNWSFMEDYIKQEQKAQVQKLIGYYENRINLNNYELLSLEDIKWKNFILGDLFDIRIGKAIDGNKIQNNIGMTPYITRKATNNGLDNFIDGYPDNFLYSDVPVITIGNETAKPFVQEVPFYTGTKVNILKPKVSLEKYELLFVSMALEKVCDRYSYSFTANSTRLKKQIIMLPVDENGNPYWEYMCKYMQKLEYEKLIKVTEYLRTYLN